MSADFRFQIIAEVGTKNCIKNLWFEAILNNTSFIHSPIFTVFKILAKTILFGTNIEKKQEVYYLVQLVTVPKIFGF